MKTELEKLIALGPDFPAPGVVFRDISPLLAQRFNDVIRLMSDLFSANEMANIDAFAGVDSRGFIFASALAAKHNKNMIMIRKKGKLPPPTIEASYALEYGQATLELPATGHTGGRVLVLDDVLATGGTLKAAADLCTQAGYDVRGLATLIDLKFLNDFMWQSQKVRSVFQYA